MEKALSDLLKKIKTKEDLTEYMKEITAMENYIFDGGDVDFWNRELKNERQENIREALTKLKEDSQNLETIKNLKRDRNELIEKEERLSNYKKEMNQLVRSLASGPKKDRLREKIKSIEKERRGLEEEIWKKEDKISELLEKNNFIDEGEFKKNQSIKRLFNKLRNQLSEISQVKMEVAFSPSRETVEEFIQWFEENMNKRVVLDLTVNPEIMGGVIIEHEGRWIDMSLKEKLKDYDLNIAENSEL